MFFAEVMSRWWFVPQVEQIHSLIPRPSIPFGPLHINGRNYRWFALQQPQQSAGMSNNNVKRYQDDYDKSSNDDFEKPANIDYGTLR